MQCDKLDKEVQRPREDDVADQACSRSRGWRSELCETFSVAAAVSAAGEHATIRESLHATRRATTETPEMAATDQATALQVCHSRWARGVRPRHYGLAEALRFGLAVPA
jgi:hypothetical protein